MARGTSSCWKRAIAGAVNPPSHMLLARSFCLPCSLRACRCYSALSIGSALPWRERQVINCTYR